MYSNTPTSKFLVLAPIQSGPDAAAAAAITPDCPQLDTPATPSPSASYASSTTSSSSSSSYDESGFLYLGYHQPIISRRGTTLSDPNSTSDTESIPEPGSVSTSISPSNSQLQCLPLTGKEWKPVVTSSLPRGTVPERFTTMPLFLNF